MPSFGHPHLSWRAPEPLTTARSNCVSCRAPPLRPRSAPPPCSAVAASASLSRLDVAVGHGKGFVSEHVAQHVGVDSRAGQPGGQGPAQVMEPHVCEPGQRAGIHEHAPGPPVLDVGLAPGRKYPRVAGALRESAQGCQDRRRQRHDTRAGLSCPGTPGQSQGSHAPIPSPGFRRYPKPGHCRHLDRRHGGALLGFKAVEGIGQGRQFGRRQDALTRVAQRPSRPVGKGSSVPAAIPTAPPE